MRSLLSRWYFRKRLLICLIIAVLLATIVWFITLKLFSKPLKQYPFMAFVYSEYENTSQNCGGTLITRRYILTAAHCVQGALIANIYLGTESITEPEESAQLFLSKTFIIHDNYDDTTFDNDIALIYLNTEVALNDNIETVNFFPRKWYKSANSGLCKVLGWGDTNLTEEYGPDSNLKIKNVNLSNTVQCTNFTSNNPNIFDNSKICASGTNGPCIGDSGGPLICNNLQIGILSGGDEYCFESVYTSISYYWEWIQWHINNN